MSTFPRSADGDKFLARRNSDRQPTIAGRCLVAAFARVRQFIGYGLVRCKAETAGNDRQLSEFVRTCVCKCDTGCDANIYGMFVECNMKFEQNIQHSTPSLGSDATALGPIADYHLVTSFMETRANKNNKTSNGKHQPYSFVSRWLGARAKQNGRENTKM